jgi:purine nucleosidase
LKHLISVGIMLAALQALAARPVVLVTDCGNWFDDQMAIIYLLISPDIELKGIIASQYGTPDGPLLAAKSIHNVLQSLGREKTPVWLGATAPLGTDRKPIRSEGALNLADLARKGQVNVLCISAATDVASAILLCGTAASNIRVTWVGGGPLPKGGRGDHNLANDVWAANVLFDSLAEMFWIPAVGSADAIQLTSQEIRERFGSFGRAGKALVSATEGIGREPATLWDLSAIGIFLYPGNGVTERVPAPSFNADYQIATEKGAKQVITYTQVRVERLLKRFADDLKAWARRPGEG